MSAHNSKGGGSAAAAGPVVPKFNSISPSAGQSYLTYARKYCLQTLSEVVSTFCKGVVPIEMLEIPLSYDKRNMLGRKAGKYTDEDGTIMTVDQSVADWRKQLIAKTREENKNCSEMQALSLLFPLANKRARETKRQLFASQSLQLMHNLNLLWPGDAMILEMEKNRAIQDASDALDLIAWEKAFTAFCLDNCGNADMNVRAAEDTLDSTVMRGHDLSGYVKAFRIAYNNVRQCNSSYTEKRVVELFIRNLNQSSDAFFRFSQKILDRSDSLHSLASQPLELSITHVENYYKSVIVPELAAAKRNHVTSTNVVKSVKELKHLMNSSSDSNSGPISVPMPVLAMMFNKNNNNNANFNATQGNNNNKRKVEVEKDSDRKKFKNNKKKSEADATAKTEVKTETPINTSIANSSDPKKKTDKRICYNFQKEGECKFGENCHFRHSA